jgi:hypothetical protein
MINKLELLTDEPLVDSTMKSHVSKYKLPKNAEKQIVGYRQEKICYQRS